MQALHSAITPPTPPTARPPVFSYPPRNPPAPTPTATRGTRARQLPNKSTSRQVGNPRTPARARLHPVFAPPAAPHRPPPAAPRTLSSLTRRVNQQPPPSSSSCLHPPPHHAPAAPCPRLSRLNPPPCNTAARSNAPRGTPHPVFSYPPGKPCPCTHSTCER